MASRKLAGDLSMKNSKWMVGVLVVLSFLTSCSKSKGPSPEDTSLIKGTDRGTFIGSAEDFAERNGDDLSPIGASISGLDGEDGLLPQDPFWSDSDNLANGDRPFDPIFFGFDCRKESYNMWLHVCGSRFE